MQATTKVYPTIREARNALALDTGFDPFRSGGWGRCTKAKLAEAGYPVDREEWERRQEERQERERQGLCRECGAPAELQLWCDAHGVGNCSRCPRHTGYCRRHAKESYVCDDGHRWTATEEEDRANGHKCPRCGEPWV